MLLALYKQEIEDTFFGNHLGDEHTVWRMFRFCENHTASTIR